MKRHCEGEEMERYKMRGKGGKGRVGKREGKEEKEEEG